MPVLRRILMTPLMTCQYFCALQILKKIFTMKHFSIFIFCFFLCGLIMSCRQEKENIQLYNQAIIANPLNLNYRFQFPDNDPSRREAADPVCEYFNGKYYLFASKSGGYWSSLDLVDWTYIPSKSIATIENYAPTILVIDDYLYYMGSWEPDKIYRTTNPDIDDWELIDSKLHYPEVGAQDPAFFRDDNGKVYMYWGCSNVDPIFGVEVDPNDGFKVVGDAVAVIRHQSDKYGWEASGQNNELNQDGWNEGPCMIKYKGKYYLQYAGPGTEFRVYADGIYIGDHPLGPFTYMENSPFSFKPGGFIGGAGHGHTFLDKYGNYWHVASMRISVRHAFERRLGLFPVFFSEDNNLYGHCAWTDYPFYIPNKKVDFERESLSAGWNLLSYNKQVTASSFLDDYNPEKAVDEQIESWWSAKTGAPGEWFQVDLGKSVSVNAIQVNFADQGFTNQASNSYVYYQYLLECSNDGTNWEILVDRSDNLKDAPHELIVLPETKQTRYLRITNKKELTGQFSISDLRVFGNGDGKLPHLVTELQIQRDEEDRRIIRLKWNKQAVPPTGYILRWGVDKNRLYNTAMVFGNEYEGRSFNRDSEYYFSIDSFNENGIVTGTQVYQ